MIFKSKSALLATMAVCGLSLWGAVSAAPAALIVTLSNGATTASITDNLAGDSNPNPGQITYVGAVGGFSTTITIATSNSPGAPTGAILQMSSIDVRNDSSNQQTLSITVGDTDFILPSGAFLGSAFAGTFTNAQIGDSTAFQSFADSSNTQYGQSGPTVTTTGAQSFVLATGISPTSFNTLDAWVPFASPTAYSLTNLTSITLAPGAQSNVSGTTTVTVSGPGSGSDAPEPATLALLVPGALALLIRRRHVRVG
jgi:hypothetical protein